LAGPCAVCAEARRRLGSKEEVQTCVDKTDFNMVRAVIFYSLSAFDTIL
jgi:hypothetical protein